MPIVFFRLNNKLRIKKPDKKILDKKYYCKNFTLVFSFCFLKKQNFRQIWK